ncbi:MAG: hypothetical protein CL607_17765 [Anaerolineaceae bacterium]|nr:hypothetical protein [Anaerolineaceae bacterium]
MPKKLIRALIGLLVLILATSLTIVAQSAPSVPILPQSQGLLTENGFGEPDITVDSTLDTVDSNPGDGLCADVVGQCTLRAAIMESNAFPLTQTIYVPAGTYLLTIPGTDEDAAATGDLDITDAVLMIGAGRGQTVIDANDIDRVFHFLVYGEPFFDDITITNVTIQGGNAPYGGGVLVDDDVPLTALRYVTIRDNYVYGQHPCGQSAGAALYAGSIVYLTGGLITENQTPSISLETTYSTVSGDLWIQTTSIINNETDWAYVAKSECENDTPHLYTLNSLIANNSGGALYVGQLDDTYGFRIVTSTITGHSAGISIGDPDKPSYFPVEIWQVTLADNGQYGLKIPYPIELDIDNSIIAGHEMDCDVSVALALDPDFVLSPSPNRNLFSDKSCPTDSLNTLINTDPLLLPLADNGGETLTRALADNSPAIGTPSDCTNSHFRDDQRGTIPVGGGCSIGAYEYNDLDTDFPPMMSGPLGNSGDPDLQHGLSYYFYLPFSQAMFDPPGDENSHDVTNPDNYLLVRSDIDAGVLTTFCAGSVQTSSLVVPIKSIVYGEPWPINYSSDTYGVIGTTLIKFDALAVGGTEYYLPDGTYTFYVCDEIHNKGGVPLAGIGIYDPYLEYIDTVMFTKLSSPLPQVTQLDVQYADAVPSAQIYPGSSPVTLEPDIAFFEFKFADSMDGYSLIDPQNVQLIQGGSNGVVETSTCDALNADDRFVTYSSFRIGNYYGNSYVPGPDFLKASPYLNARLELSQSLDANAYRLILCDEITSLEDVPLDGDFDGVPGGDFMLDFFTDGFVPPLPTPAAPTLNDYSDGLVALHLPTVGDVPDGTVMQIGRLTGESSSIVGSVDVSTATFVDSNLTCETAYRYRVRLYDANENQFSAWSDYLDITTTNCVTSLQHTFGLYKEGQWLFYAVDGNQRDDVRFQFGPEESGWTALVGDWNGDDMPGIGLYKAGTFMLRELSGTDVTDSTFAYGPASGAVPLAGDWDGNGTDTVGVFVGGTFFLRNSNTTGLADLSFSLGSASSMPLAGDWNGDGTDSVGYFENNTFNLAASGMSPTVDASFGFGPLGWSPIAGDWNGDLKDTIGLYSNGLWRLRNTNNAGPVDYGFSYGDLAGGWQPLAFDGDTSVLNRLFNATVPTPRVPVIPGPKLPIVPTEGSSASLPPSLHESPVEPTLDASSVLAETNVLFPAPSATPDATIVPADMTPTAIPVDSSTLEDN